ncbi:MAG TPA: hypothetical protein VGM23_03595, partial [Armatimonadota bacterium]
AAWAFRECMKPYMPGMPTPPGTKKTRETAADILQTISNTAHPIPGLAVCQARNLVSTPLYFVLCAMTQRNHLRQIMLGKVRQESATLREKD